MAIPKKAILRNYQDVRHLIFNGDVLMYRGGNWPGAQLISRFGWKPSPYCHAAMAARWETRLFLLETVQWKGGRACALSQQVRDYPGRWDVFSVRDRKGFDPEVAVRSMIDTVGTRYGAMSLAVAAIAHLPLIRNYCVLDEVEQEEDDTLPFCSMAVSRALRKGGIDPIPNVADRFTEPGNLAASRKLKFKFTLDWRNEK